MADVLDHLAEDRPLLAVDGPAVFFWGLILVVALAGPQRVETIQEETLEGRGLSLVVDLSSSMLAEDMGDRQSRISLAREAAVRFASGSDEGPLSIDGGLTATQ